MEVPNYKDLNCGNAVEKSIKKHYPEFHQYLIDTYPDISWSEKLYWYYNNIYTYPVCLVCENRTKFINLREGYRKYCSCKCMNNDPSKKEQVKQTNIKRYGGVAPACSQTVRNKMINTTKERYGVDNVMTDPNFVQKSVQTMTDRYGGPGNSSSILLEKYKNTNIKKYGVDNPMKSQSIKNKLINGVQEKYGVDWVTKIPNTKLKIKEKLNNPQVRSKIDQSKRDHHTFNTSSAEELFKQYLESRDIQYIYQYKSSAYPFNCDFYIPSLDLYIEIQGSWTHGGHPYGSQIDDHKTLQQWRKKSINSLYFANAIEVWTQRDVKKRLVAKENNLNYLEIFSNKIEQIIYEYEQYTSNPNLH